MEARFKTVDASVLTAQGEPTGIWRYRVIDTLKGAPINQHGVYENKEEAKNVCAQLNTEQSH